MMEFVTTVFFDIGCGFGVCGEDDETAVVAPEARRLLIHYEPGRRMTMSCRNRNTSVAWPAEHLRCHRNRTRAQDSRLTCFPGPSSCCLRPSGVRTIARLIAPYGQSFPLDRSRTKGRNDIIHPVFR